MLPRKDRPVCRQQAMVHQSKPRGEEDDKQLAFLFKEGEELMFFFTLI